MERIIYYIYGLLSGGILVFAGIQMLMIHSMASTVGNITTAEAFYHAIGIGFIGLGILAFGLLVVLSPSDNDSDD